MHLFGFILRLLGLMCILASIFFGMFCILRPKKSLSTQEDKTQNHSRTMLAIGCFLDIVGTLVGSIG